MLWVTTNMPDASCSGNSGDVPAQRHEISRKQPITPYGPKQRLMSFTRAIDHRIPDSISDRSTVNDERCPPKSDVDVATETFAQPDPKAPSAQSYQDEPSTQRCRDTNPPRRALRFVSKRAMSFQAKTAETSKPQMSRAVLVGTRAVTSEEIECRSLQQRPAGGGSVPNMPVDSRMNGNEVSMATSIDLGIPSLSEGDQDVSHGVNLMGLASARNSLVESASVESNPQGVTGTCHQPRRAVAPGTLASCGSSPSASPRELRVVSGSDGSGPVTPRSTRDTRLEENYVSHPLRQVGLSLDPNDASSLAETCVETPSSTPRRRRRENGEDRLGGRQRSLVSSVKHFISDRHATSARRRRSLDCGSDGSWSTRSKLESAHDAGSAKWSTSTPTRSGTLDEDSQVSSIGGREGTRWLPQALALSSAPTAGELRTGQRTVAEDMLNEDHATRHSPFMLRNITRKGTATANPNMRNALVGVPAFHFSDHQSEDPLVVLYAEYRNAFARELVDVYSILKALQQRLHEISAEHIRLLYSFWDVVRRYVLNIVRLHETALRPWYHDIGSGMSPKRNNPRESDDEGSSCSSRGDGTESILISLCHQLLCSLAEVTETRTLFCEDQDDGAFETLVRRVDRFAQVALEFFNAIEVEIPARVRASTVPDRAAAAAAKTARNFMWNQPDAPLLLPILSKWIDESNEPALLERWTTDNFVGPRRLRFLLWKANMDRTHFAIPARIWAELQDA